MKRKLFFFLVVFLAAATLSSCRYEDGPYLSFVNPETRIVGYWEVADVYLNDEEFTDMSDPAHQKGSYYAFFIERMLSVTATKNNYIVESVTGAWDFQNNAKDLYVFFNLNNKKYTYTAHIKRLSKHELWYEYKDENGNVWLLKMNNRSNIY